LRATRYLLPPKGKPEAVEYVGARVGGQNLIPNPNLNPNPNPNTHCAFKSVLPVFSVF